jgi:hypothetical protein
MDPILCKFYELELNTLDWWQNLPLVWKDSLSVLISKITLTVTKDTHMIRMLDFNLGGASNTGCLHSPSSSPIYLHGHSFNLYTIADLRRAKRIMDQECVPLNIFTTVLLWLASILCESPIVTTSRLGSRVLHEVMFSMANMEYAYQRAHMDEYKDDSYVYCPPEHKRADLYPSLVNVGTIDTAVKFPKADHWWVLPRSFYPLSPIASRTELFKILTIYAQQVLRYEMSSYVPLMVEDAKTRMQIVKMMDTFKVVLDNTNGLNRITQWSMGSYTIQVINDRFYIPTNVTMSGFAPTLSERACKEVISFVSQVVMQLKMHSAFSQSSMLGAPSGTTVMDVDMKSCMRGSALDEYVTWMRLARMILIATMGTYAIGGIGDVKNVSTIIMEYLHDPPNPFNLTWSE